MRSSVHTHAGACSAASCVHVAVLLACVYASKATDKGTFTGAAFSWVSRCGGLVRSSVFRKCPGCPSKLPLEEPPAYSGATFLAFFPLSTYNRVEDQRSGASVRREELRKWGHRAEGERMLWC
eukprot:7443759-Pyramimonas_sp.AAC.1